MRMTRRGFFGLPLLTGAAWLPTGGGMADWAPMPDRMAHTGTIGVFVARTNPVSQLSLYQGRERFRQVLHRELEDLERRLLIEYDKGHRSP